MMMWSVRGLGARGWGPGGGWQPGRREDESVGRGAAAALVSTVDARGPATPLCREEQEGADGGCRWMFPTKNASKAWIFTRRLSAKESKGRGGNGPLGYRRNGARTGT